MYAISNKQQKEIIELLSSLSALSGNDNKTANIKRRSAIIVEKLTQKSKTK